MQFIALTMGRCQGCCYGVKTKNVVPYPQPVASILWKVSAISVHASRSNSQKCAVARVVTKESKRKKFHHVAHPYRLFVQSFGEIGLRIQEYLVKMQFIALTMGRCQGGCYGVKTKNVQPHSQKFGSILCKVSTKSVQGSRRKSAKCAVARVVTKESKRKIQGSQILPC